MHTPPLRTSGARRLIPSRSRASGQRVMPDGLNDHERRPDTRIHRRHPKHMPFRTISSLFRRPAAGEANKRAECVARSRLLRARIPTPRTKTAAYAGSRYRNEVRIVIRTLPAQHRAGVHRRFTRGGTAWGRASLTPLLSTRYIRCPFARAHLVPRLIVGLLAQLVRAHR